MLSIAMRAEENSEGHQSGGEYPPITDRQDEIEECEAGRKADGPGQHDRSPVLRGCLCGRILDHIRVQVGAARYSPTCFFAVNCRT